MAKKKNSAKNQEASPNKEKVADPLAAESGISSCMEAATTPCVNIGEVVETAELTEMCSDLAQAPCKDDDDAYSELADSPCTEVSARPSMELISNSQTEIQSGDSGVSDLVAQQLRQMIEEGGGTATCASAGSFTGTHTMNLNVKAGAVDMNLSTVTEANQELIELKTQIELQKRLLTDAQDRLDAANKRIGFLESELARKDKEKQEQSGWLKSLFGI